MLTVDELLARVYAQVGFQKLAEYDELHLEGLRQLLSSIASARDLRVQAGPLLEHELLVMGAKSIAFEKDLVAYPEIRNVPIAVPMFIIGFGRTGSTLLHNLLALDPVARAPQFWELRFPSPPPRKETYRTDPRIGATRAYLAQVAAAMPGLLRIHPMEAQAPDECHWMMRHGPQHVLRFPGMSYWEWFRSLAPEKLQRFYAYYKLQIQHLQLFFPNRHWVSKSLVHQLYFPVLFDIFPDARVIRLHRDPCNAIPSLASLTARTRVVYQDRIDANELGRFMLDWFVLGATRMTQADRKHGSNVFFDVMYDDLVGDPIRVVQAIYAHFGQNYTAEFDGALRRYMQASAAQQKSYQHSYQLEQFGLSRSQVVAETGEYLSWLRERASEGRIGKQ